MKITKKVTSIVLALMLVISAFAGLSITAGAVMPDQNSITLTIHKGDIDQVGDASTQTAGDDAVIGNTGELTGTTADVPEGFKALTGQSVTFTIYYVGGMDTPVPATADVGEYDEITEVTTNTSTGEATFSLNNSYTYPDGVTDKRGLYYVEETASPDKVTTKAQSFFVYLPMTTQNTGTANDGVTWNGDVHVYPKNLTTLGGAVLTKTINNVAPSAAGTVDQYPQFTLYEQIGTKDVDSIVDDVEIATITIGVDYESVTSINSLPRYATVEIAQKDGVIAVDGLPAAFGSDGVATTAYYYFKETRATTIGSETLPLATDFDFSVAPGTNVDVETRDDNTEANPPIDFAAISTTTNANLDNYQATKDNSSTPTISKTVYNQQSQTYVDTNGGSYDIDNQSVNWRVTAPLPADLSTHKNYVITDKLDKRLTLIADEANSSGYAIVVTAENADGDDVALTYNTDYTVSVTDVAVSTEDTTQTKLITITLVSPSKTMTDTVKTLNSGELQIDIATTINDNAMPKANADDTTHQIPNKATVTFTNQYDADGTDDSNEPFVYTAGFNAIKVDANDDTPLSGVEFTLERVTPNPEYDADTNPDVDQYIYTPINVVADGAAGKYCVETAPTQGEPASTVVTGTDGKIFVRGLAEGAYRLTETKTNNGYQLLAAPVAVNVTEGGYIEGEATIEIPNVPTPDLPLTGGMGTILFTVAGLVLIGGAAFFFIRSRKSSKEEA